MATLEKILFSRNLEDTILIYDDIRQNSARVPHSLQNKFLVS